MSKCVRPGLAPWNCRITAALNYTSLAQTLSKRRSTRRASDKHTSPLNNRATSVYDSASSIFKMFSLFSRRVLITALLLCSFFVIQAYASKAEAVGAPMNAEEIEEALQVVTSERVHTIELILT